MPNPQTQPIRSHRIEQGESTVVICKAVVQIRSLERHLLTLLHMLTPEMRYGKYLLIEEREQAEDAPGDM